jgi:hypothetical protein
MKIARLVRWIHNVWLALVIISAIAWALGNYGLSQNDFISRWLASSMLTTALGAILAWDGKEYICAPMYLYRTLIDEVGGKVNVPIPLIKKVLVPDAIHTEYAWAINYILCVVWIALLIWK